MIGAAIAIVVILIVLAASSRLDFALPGVWRDRSCQGAGWRRAFPSASKTDIREFLSVFANAFAFSENQRLRFGPEDRVYAIYRALYSGSWGVDGLELETLAKKMEKAYSVQLKELWSEDLTLGQLFKASVDRSQKSNPAFQRTAVRPLN